MRPTARNSAAASAGNRNRHCDDGLPIFVIGHHGGQIGAADEREQPLFILAQTRQPGFQIVENVDVGHDGMMRNALQRLVAEMAGLAAADHRRGDVELSKAAQARQRGDDRRHVADLIFGEVTGFRARIGDQLLAVAVIQLLRHRQRLVGGPSPTLAAGLLQGGEIEETWRRLTLFVDRDAERPLDSPPAALAIASAWARSLIRILAGGA